MLNQEQRKSPEVERHTRRDHCRWCHYRRFQSGFGFGCMAGEARAAAADSLRRPTPSRPSIPCLNSLLTPAPDGLATRRSEKRR